MGCLTWVWVWCGCAKSDGWVGCESRGHTEDCTEILPVGLVKDRSRARRLQIFSGPSALRVCCSASLSRFTQTVREGLDSEYLGESSRNGA